MKSIFACEYNGNSKVVFLLFPPKKGQVHYPCIKVEDGNSKAWVNAKVTHTEVTQFSVEIN